MDNLTYIECISANLLMSQCCVCDCVVGYKDAGRELQIGDRTISHTYCAGCFAAIHARQEQIRQRFD